MRTMKPEQKRMMIKAQQSKSKNTTQSIVQLIHVVRGTPTTQNLQNLRVALNQADDNVLQQFLNANGIQMLLEIVNKFSRKPSYVQYSL